MDTGVASQNIRYLMGALSGNSRELRIIWLGARWVCLSVCLSVFTQATLYTTTTVYGVLVHHQGTSTPYTVVVVYNVA